MNTGKGKKDGKEAPVPSLASIVAKIRRALRNQGTYTDDLDIAVRTTAGAYRAFLTAQRDVARLGSTYYETKSREGNRKYMPHPAIKTMKDTQEMVQSGLKLLGLTMDSLTSTDYDPLEKLVDSVNSIKR